MHFLSGIHAYSYCQVNVLFHYKGTFIKLHVCWLFFYIIQFFQDVSKYGWKCWKISSQIFDFVQCSIQACSWHKATWSNPYKYSHMHLNSQLWHVFGTNFEVESWPWVWRDCWGRVRWHAGPPSCAACSWWRVSIPQTSFLAWWYRAIRDSIARTHYTTFQTQPWQGSDTQSLWNNKEPHLRTTGQ